MKKLLPLVILGLLASCEMTQKRIASLLGEAP